MKRSLQALIVLSLGSALGMAIAFLWHFVNIAEKGSHYIQEPNIIILNSEILLLSFLAVGAFCTLYLFIQWCRKNNKLI